ncbi:tripartite tricarboxylate transporter permease [Rhizobium beringeri]|uniref:tripartite tricarboxylate transporter permease n=1 Tax=Rhizobium beringeri TaxID=3019934 RepID=UPI003B5AEEF4
MLFPAIVVFSSIGCYSINNNLFDANAIIFWGILGYVLIRVGFELAPRLLGSL